MGKIFPQIIIIKIENELLRRESLHDLIFQDAKRLIEVRRNGEIARQAGQGAAIIGGCTIEEAVNATLDEAAQRIEADDQQQQINCDDERIVGADGALKQKRKQCQQAVEPGKSHHQGEKMCERARKEAIHIEQAVADDGIGDGKREEDETPGKSARHKTG